MVALLSCWKWLSDSGTASGRDRGDRRQRDRRAVGGLDVIVQQLVGVEARALLDLRDHLVRPAVEAEIVDVAAAQHRRQRRADIAHLEAELRGLVAVDHDRRLRLVDLEVGVHEDEHAARIGFLQEVLRHLVQRTEGAGRVDDELDRQTDGAGQRRRLEGHDLRARRPSGRPRCWIIGWIWFDVSLRWSHGFSTMPAIDWPGTSSWKTWSVSGWLEKMSKTCLEYSRRWSIVELGAEVASVMMTPWSSCGASSLLVVV